MTLTEANSYLLSFLRVTGFTGLTGKCMQVTEGLQETKIWLNIYMGKQHIQEIKIILNVINNVCMDMNGKTSRYQEGNQTKIAETVSCVGTCISSQTLKCSLRKEGGGRGVGEERGGLQPLLTPGNADL